MSSHTNLLHPYQQFISQCAHLGEAEILNIPVCEGLPIIHRADKVYRRRDLGEEKRTFTRSQKLRRRLDAVRAFIEIGNGTIPRMEIAGGVPVTIWLED